MFLVRKSQPQSNPPSKVTPSELIVFRKENKLQKRCLGELSSRPLFERYEVDDGCHGITPCGSDSRISLRGDRIDSPCANSSDIFDGY